MSYYKSGFIGGAFRPEIDAQIKLRQNKISLDVRDGNTLTWLNSNTSWVRLSSSVNVAPDIAKYFGFNGGEDLAKNFILHGGALANKEGNLGLRYGISDGRINTIRNYGTGGNNQFGIRPMPGITSADISTKNRFGSLKVASVKFQCWNLKQLEILELLYMKPGYTVLLEWGNSIYFNNSGRYENTPKPIDLFNNELTKEKIFEKIYQKSIKDTNGNYDAMFGPIKNFSWSSRPDGGYDCSVDIVTLGDVVESLKINSYGLVNTSNTNIISNDKLILSDANKSVLNRILSEIYQDGVISFEKLNYELKGEDKSNDIDFVNDLRRVYQIPFKKENNDEPNSTTNLGKHVYISLGTLLSIIKQNCLLYDDKGKPYVDIDFDINNNYCFSNEFQISMDPSVCLISFANKLYDNVNKLIYESAYRDPNNPKLGRTMRILVNLEFIVKNLSSLSSSNEDGNVDLLSFLENIIKDVQNSLGSINDFYVNYDHVTNVVSIMDNQRLANDDPDKFTEIELLGKKSLVISHNMSSKIFPKMATLIAISAQNNTEALGLDGTAFGELSSIISDRIIPVKEDKNTLDKLKDKALLDSKQENELFYNNLKDINNHIKNMNSLNYSLIDANKAKDALSSFMKYKSSHNINYNRATPIIPIELSITMKGISGIRIGEQFSIPLESLPISYKTKEDEKQTKRKVNFIVTSIHNTIDSNNQWVTTISGQTKVNERLR